MSEKTICCINAASNQLTLRDGTVVQVADTRPFELGQAVDDCLQTLADFKAGKSVHTAFMVSLDFNRDTNTEKFVQQLAQIAEREIECVAAHVDNLRALAAEDVDTSYTFCPPPARDEPNPAKYLSLFPVGFLIVVVLDLLLRGCG